MIGIEDLQQIRAFVKTKHSTQVGVPEKARFMMVQVFGDAEKLDFFDVAKRRIFQWESAEVDTSQYAGYYFVNADDLDNWSKLSKACSGGKERMEVWKDGYDGN